MLIVTPELFGLTGTRVESRLWMSQTLVAPVVLDACVLYPAPIRNLLLHIANEGLYRPKWSELIQNEWARSLLINRPNLSSRQLQQTIQAMNRAFPDATVREYDVLIRTLELPDADDRHLLAAAIHGQASLIMTANLKDFPTLYLRSFGIEPQHPDQFIARLIETNPADVLRAFQAQVASVRKPPRTAHEVLETLRRTGLEVASIAYQTCCEATFNGLHGLTSPKCPF